MRHSTYFLLNPNKKENSNLEIGMIYKIYLEKVHLNIMYLACRVRKTFLL